MRLSRPCYDKPHRCPGWAGGGWKSSRVDRCDGGSVRTYTSDRIYPASVPEANRGGYPGDHRWRFGHCTKCEVVTWPYMIRFIDPSNYSTEIRLWWARHKYEL